MIEAVWRKQNRAKTWEINYGSKYTRHSCGQSLAHIQQELQSTVAVQFKKIKNTSEYSTVDDWWLISLPRPQNLRNHFPQCLTETGTKWLYQTRYSWMCYWVWHHYWSHSIRCPLLQCPNSILITDKELTADKTTGSQFRKKKVVPMVFYAE